MENPMVILGECDEVKEESIVRLQGLRGEEDLHGATTGKMGFFSAMPSPAGCSSQMENSSKNLGVEIRVESPVIRRSDSDSDSRGSHDIIPLDQARSDQAFFNTTPPCHSSFKIAIPSLLGFVLVKCQVKSFDPSVTYPLQTWIFVVAILTYCLILWALKQSQNRSAEFLQFLSRVALAGAVLSSLSLVSVLLPHIPGLVLLYASWALSIIISASPILQCTYNRLLTGIKTLPTVLYTPASNLFTGCMEFCAATTTSAGDRNIRDRPLQLASQTNQNSAFV